jgi:uncharacterized SAM-binding protein YcdF (DUF218 family)
MFFYLSKIVWFLLQPSTLLIFIFVIGFIFYHIGRKRLGIRILIAAVAIYTIAGLSPLANALMISLEYHYPKAEIRNAGHIDGLIILGGVVDTLVTGSHEEIALNEAAERLTEASALAYRFPNARIVISGGDGAIIYRSSDEAGVAKRFFTRIGIDPARIALETESRNTWQNAVFTKKLIDPKPGERWLLITSAFHMRRAMGCFRAAGFDVIPWPVDFRTRGTQDLLRFLPSPSTAWRRIDLASKEWIGLIAYYLTGRIKNERLERLERDD